MQVSHILALPQGTPITTPITGTIKAAFPLASGAGQYGEWTRINFILQDPTGEVGVSWWEPTYTDHNALQGMQVSLMAYNTSQSQNVGCAVNEYQRKQDGVPQFDPNTGAPLMVKQIKARGRAVTLLSMGAAPPAQTTLPAGQPVGYPGQAAPAAAPAGAMAPASGKLTEDQIIERLPKWASAMDAALPSATIGEGETGRFRAIGAFCSTMAIHLAEGRLTPSTVALPAPNTGDDEIPF